MIRQKEMIQQEQPRNMWIYRDMFEDNERFKRHSVMNRPRYSRSRQPEELVPGSTTHKGQMLKDLMTTIPKVHQNAIHVNSISKYGLEPSYARYQDMPNPYKIDVNAVLSTNQGTSQFNLA